MLSFDRLLQLVLGPMLIGFALDIFLFGITTVQTYLYYLAFPNDHIVLQCLVYGVYLIGTAQTGVAVHDLFLLYSTRYGYIRPNMPSDEPGWNEGVHMIITIPICGTIVASAVQVFYAHRIRILTRNFFIPAFLVMLVALQWVGAIMVAAGTYPPQIGNKGENHPGGGTQSMNSIGFIGSLLWSCTSSACDVLIAIYMILYLLKVRPRAGYDRIRVSRLLRLILETGSLTAAVSISFVLTFVLAPGGFFVIPGLSIGKLYAISLLVLLNNRFHILGGRQKDKPSFLLPSEVVGVDTILSSIPTGFTDGRSTGA